MVNIPMNTRDGYNSQTVTQLNGIGRQIPVIHAGNVLELNHMMQNPAMAAQATAASQSAPAAVANPASQPVPAMPVTNATAASPVSQQTPATPVTPQMNMPAMNHKIQKGQKVAISQAPVSALKACFGWNTTNSQCDVDVSAFLLGDNGKVLGDDWFVFYGQDTSPDRAVVFKNEGQQDRQSVSVQLSSLNPAVKKIVFVLTINEALNKQLNFGMMKDAYVRILDGQTGVEYCSFVMEEYYSNVISMMIGEVYLHNGQWKFNAVGNGVAKDLEGLCQLYGVQVDG